ncbi:hypothetical protein SDC9_120426 [bioreactor metagenome]|uniref:Uncharacterized protein n=1 Tax=bioreactor metagenome TaxID=1076179 RepID=A0A645C6M6_9ZZZZ
MSKSLNLERALDIAIRGRRAAAARKYDAGERRNPFQAQQGHERTFDEAGRDVRAYDLILKLLENEVKLERARAALPRKQAARKIANLALDFLVLSGLLCVAMLGPAAALVLAGVGSPVAETVAVIGVGTALAWAAFARK